MNSNLERIRKEAVVAQMRYNPRIFLEVQKKKAKQKPWQDI
jgi:hypothetical protein